MKLSQEQIEVFDREGWLFLPELFSPEETTFLAREAVTRLVEQGGIVAPTGKPGGMLMFHGNLVHGSAGNITPYPRKIVYLTLNAVSNYIRTPTRPDYIAHRDFTPIRMVDDDALVQLACAHREAAE
jgi:ectoine hydroxylase